MDPLDNLLKHDTPLDQPTLSILAKSTLRKGLVDRDGLLSSDRVKATWLKLLTTGLDSTVTDRHLTAACNCIAVFLLNAASSQSEVVRSFAFAPQTWFQGYDCAWKAFSDGKTKPALQVLETLSHLLSEHPRPEVSLSVLKDSAAGLLKIILTGTPQKHIKISCVALSCYLRTTSFQVELVDILEDVLSQVSNSCKRYQGRNNVSPDVLMSTRPSGMQVLLLALLFAARNLETRSASLKVLVQLCRFTENDQSSQNYTTWAAQMFQIFISNNTDALGDFADNVLPVILDQQLRFDTFLGTYQIHKDSTAQQIVLWLAVLKIGKLKKYIAESGIRVHPLQVNSDS